MLPAIFNHEMIKEGEAFMKRLTIKFITTMAVFLMATSTDAGQHNPPPPSDLPPALPEEAAGRPSYRPLPVPAPRPSKAAPKIQSEILVVEQITNWLLKAAKQNCNTLMTQTKSKIDFIPSKPEGYSGKYMTKEDYEPILAQIGRSLVDSEKKVKRLITQAKIAKEPANFVELFEKIYGEIDLNIRKNCEKYTSSIQSGLQEQTDDVIRYNKEKAEKKSGFNWFRKDSKGK